LCLCGLGRGTGCHFEGRDLSHARAGIHVMARENKSASDIRHEFRKSVGPPFSDVCPGGGNQRKVI